MNTTNQNSNTKKADTSGATPTKSIYTNKIICFVDILGFKDYIEQGDDKKTSDLYDILNKLNPSGIRSLLVEYLSKVEDNEQLSLSINQFSDSFVISCDATDTFSTKILVRALIALEYILLGKIGLMMRGGVCLGKLVHDDNSVIFGPAMIEAYRLESQVAKSPRIIFTEDAYNLIKGCVPDAKIFTYVDTDNYRSMDAISTLKLSLIELIRAKHFHSFDLLYYASSKRIADIHTYANALSTERHDQKTIDSIKSKSNYINLRFEEFKLQIDTITNEMGIKITHHSEHIAQLSIANLMKYVKFLDSHFAFARQFQGKAKLAY